MPGHVPVLKEEAVQLLLTDPTGAYVDVALGGGGHAAAILESLGVDGRLVGLDCDPAAIDHARAMPPAPDPRFVAGRASFSEIRPALQGLGISVVDGILADLGISSIQPDDASRRPYYTASVRLAMRLDPSPPTTTYVLPPAVAADDVLPMMLE